MTLEQVNGFWTAYKERYELDSDVMIDEVLFDAPEEVEAFFDLIELLAGKRILHMTRRAHIYRTEFVKFILTHEFTHLYDFLTCPFEPDRSEMLLLYMQSYSEYHACRVTLDYLIKDLSRDNRVYVNKNQIPGPFKDISIRRLLEESLLRTRIAYEQFYVLTMPNMFVNGFRHLMYLMGYISLLNNDEETLVRTLKVLRIDDGNYLLLYKALKDEDVDKILLYTRKCYDGGFIYFLKRYIHDHMDPDLYNEEELEELTPENYEEFMEILNERREQAEEAASDMEGEPIAAFVSEVISAGRYPDAKTEMFSALETAFTGQNIR